MEEIVRIAAKPIAYIGATVLVIGLIYLGIQLKDGMQGGGGQLAGAIAMIVGGAIVCGAAIYFGSLDTSWSGAAATMTNTIYVDAAPASWTADASSFHLIA